MKGTKLNIFIFGLMLLVLSLSTSVQGGNLYRCVNSQGSILLTDSIPTDPDYKCTFSASYKDLTPQERANEQREMEAKRQKIRAANAKYDAEKRAEVAKQEAIRRANRAQEESRQKSENERRAAADARNRRADKVESDARERLKFVRDKGIKLPQANIDMLGKAAAAKADQIRKGTDTPMTASEDAEFHRRQDIDSALQWHNLQKH